VALVAGTITTAVLPHRTRSGRKRPASLTPERACS
jgi:hypothetical protein